MLHEKKNKSPAPVRETMGILPSTVAAEMPSRFRRHSMSSKKRVNWEKTSASKAAKTDES